jgi:diaminopimelate decarboxylase
MLRFAVEVQDQTGIRISRLNLGGGLAGRTSFDLAASVTQPPARSPWDARMFFAPLHEEIRAFEWPIELAIEPGRYVVDDAAVGLASVVGTARSAGRNWWIVDLGSHVLIPFGGREFPAISLQESPSSSTQTVSIGDRLSTFSGVLAQNLPIEAPKSGTAIGTLLAFPQAGAYTTSAAQQFMFGMPSVLWWDGTEIKMMSPRETPEQWVRRVGGADLPSVETDESEK